jgi:hypothetical protein
MSFFRKVLNQWLGRMKVFFRTFLFAFLAIAITQSLAAQDWQEAKGKHFIVFYVSDADKEFADTILRRAETYYQRIGDRVGYTRYGDFWTWDQRAKILLFPDQQSFTATTKQPLWSTGFADRNAKLFQSRSIMTFKQEYEFFNGLLPHEISHLILHDFIAKDIPVWFDEGVAQIDEGEKSEIVKQMMHLLVERNRQLPFETFVNWDKKIQQDPQKVKIFYAQSLSVVEFLLKKYGSDAFVRLCRYLRDGRSFEEAFKGAYTNKIQSLAELEKRWVQEMLKE